ncbi:MAG: DUF6526 family protein [Bryobacteraceae bacterium]|nr:DUF6526 family protein [Bryobacteraceae bacterium]
MSQQNFENHSQTVPGYLAAAFAVMATVIGAGVNLYLSLGDHQRLYSASLILVLSVCVFFIGWYARVFPLKAQDRAIRAEENLRHYVLTGKLLDPRLEPLQIVALRFASDDEFPALARKAADERMAPRDIKRAVRNWRADTYRV